MTIQEAITRAFTLTGFATATFETAQLVTWLSELDGQIALECFHNETWQPYDATDDDELDSELLVSYPWDGDIYTHWLEAQMYYAAGEYDRYENAQAAYNAALKRFRAFVARLSRPAIIGGTISNIADVTVVAGVERSVLWTFLSAYGIAVKHGYTGTEEQWLDEITHYNREAAGDAAASATVAAASATAAAASAASAVSSATSATASAASADLSAGSATSAAETATTAATNAATSANDAAISYSGAAQSAATAAECESTATTAAASAANKSSSAAASASDAEAWAVGTRNGVDVGSGDPAYHNNAKYYAENMPEDIFWCTYGTTTYAEIAAALVAEKLPVCVMDGVELVYTKNIGAALDFITGHCFQGVNNSSSTAAIYRAVCGTDSEWYSDSVSLATAQALSDGLADKQNTLTFDSAPTESSDNPVKSGGIYTALAGKQSTLTFDSTPTSGSNNPVKSRGIKTAIDDSKPIVITQNGMSVASACNAAHSGLLQGRSVYVEIITYRSGGVADTLRLYLTNEVMRASDHAYYFGSFVDGTLYGIKLSRSSGWGELVEIPLGGA